MNSATIATIVTVCLFGAVFVGMRIRALLPTEHLNSETKDSIKVSMGLVATMTALVLGLLVSSAKGSYDATRSQVIQMASKVAFLDRVLELYGPEAASVRMQLRATVQGAVAQVWPSRPVASQLAPDVKAGDSFFSALQQMTPADDAHRTLKSQAAALALEVGQIRMQLVAESISAISAPLLVVVVCWLTILFISFSVLSPRNFTSTFSSLVAAASVAGAVFLILELDRPFSGLVRISSDPLHAALPQLLK